MGKAKNLQTRFWWQCQGRTHSFLDSNLGNLRPKTVSVQVVSPQVSRMKRWRMLANSSTNADEVPFRRGRWQVRPLKWNMPVNSKRGLEHEAHLREVCASNAHQRQLPDNITTAVVLHLPSSPYLIPYNFFSSPRIKPKVWRRPLQGASGKKKKGWRSYTRFQKSRFQRNFQDWQNRWTHCTYSEVDHLGGKLIYH